MQRFCLCYKIDCYNAAVHAWQLLWDVLYDAVEEDTLYTLKPDKKKKHDKDKEVRLVYMSMRFAVQQPQLVSAAP